MYVAMTLIFMYGLVEIVEILIVLVEDEVRLVSLLSSVEQTETVEGCEVFRIRAGAIGACLV